MQKIEKTVWTAPALRKLGTIADVAGSVPGATQSPGQGTARS